MNAVVREIMFDKNIDWYTEKFKMAKYKTIYNDPHYLHIEETAEKYPIYLYCLEEKDSFVILPMVKKCINDLSWIDEKEELFDVITPHEYGGVISNDDNKEIIKKFYSKFSDFCRSNGIISAFIRFNPYMNDYLMAVCFDVKKISKHVSVRLNVHSIHEGYTSNCRRNIRHAKDNMVTCYKASDEDNGEFKNIYREAMLRLNAKSFLFFNDDYFDKLTKFDNTSLYYSCIENEKCAAAIVLYDNYNKIAYYHLGCRKSERVLSGLYESLVDCFIKDSKEKGYEIMHLGGGTKESLQRFKKKFSNNSVEYYVGHAVFCTSKYNSLAKKYLDLNPDEINSDFFPLYRLGE